MSDNLREAALQGRTDLLYAVIEADPYVLDNIDKISFVETPLHIAASVGNISFATKIMRLKPSFARKPNQQGLCPIHLAVENGHDRMVHRFVNKDENLIRIKGKDGFTPLHTTSRAGQIDLLAEFLLVCPKSIQDVTIENENALHVAVKSDQFQVVDFLVCWMQWYLGRDAEDLQNSTLNMQDELGNTILHILVGLNDPNPELNCYYAARLTLNAKNFDGLTALDIVESSNPNSIVRDILVSAGALRGDSIYSPRLAQLLPSNVIFWENFRIKQLRRRINLMSDEQRNASLVTAVLVGTMTFQASQDPPGRVFQVDSEKSPLIRNSTKTIAKIYAGKTVMKDGVFTSFWIINTLALLLSISAIYVLLPSRRNVPALVSMPVLYIVLVYFLSMSIISPPNILMTEISLIVVFSFLLFILPELFVVAVLSPRLSRYYRLMRKILESRFSSIN